MSQITTINSGDLISGSRTDINTNFANLNTDKIETSVIDTDTTLAANSDSKIATQKATKAYADSVVGANASETAKGVVEEATDAEVTAGTATGATGAKLIVTPAKLSTRLTTVLASYQPTMVFKCGVASKNIADASTTQTIAHGLGIAPKVVRLTALIAATERNYFVSGVYNGTTNCMVWSSIMNGATSSGAGSSTAMAIALSGDDTSGAPDDPTTTTSQTGVVTWDATNITITWTKQGSPTGTKSFLWEAQA